MRPSSTSPDHGPRSFPFLFTQRHRTQGYREWLTAPPNDSSDNGVSLTMLWIPPGRFLMGSPADEAKRLDREGPQHLVQLQGFFLGQTPVTQAQWQAVAGWKPLNNERFWSEKLAPDPVSKLWERKRFEGAQRPVVSVSWTEAMRFCRRLSQRTGRYYTLPSEAQWEYACRAGTTTPFHFGATLSTELANYDGNYIYADGHKGVYRQQTTDVASFPANAWGLHDMHGNVWEWCADQWHSNYDNAPEDDSPWIDNDSDEASLKPLRGGSWNCDPDDCRSAFRIRLRPGSHDDFVGFRVCYLPQA